ncbi:uncharacterized protein LOC114296433 [Camellia sinensis]|uniref:uncharacterized protein LOC114296433 n=1 Tax=Camellia sinensis TaxID=4442 RepID=UPI001036C719|nr:uncharacterized protein LOC114296433 [Camellia sinensis]
MVQWNRPTSVTEICSFLGLVGYYRRFVERFSQISMPLTCLTQKWVKFEWSDDCEKSFQDLKSRLVSTPVLLVLSGDEGFTIYSNASKMGLGCVLMQNDKLANLRVQPTLINRIKDAQGRDPQLQKLKAEMEIGLQMEFCMHKNGTLRFGGRLCVPNDLELKREILREAHSSGKLLSMLLNVCGLHTPPLVVSALQARRLLRNGCEGYFASVRDIHETGLKLEDILVVKGFPDVFPDNLPGLPPDREIEFVIKLIPGTGPISRAPYRMAQQS